MNEKAILRETNHLKSAEYILVSGVVEKNCGLE
jgi:hypothetical protein